MADNLQTKMSPQKREMKKIEYVGFALIVLVLLSLFFFPEPVANGFTAAAKKVKAICFDAFLVNIVGWAIICGVITGRLLERAGFTDALVRVFVPVTSRMGINAAVILPAIYHIVGDINAAGKIAGPIVKKAGATKDEQKIAVATMVQSQQSFSTFMLGLVSLTVAKVSAFPVIIIVIFLPMIVVPFLLKHTIYRDTKSVPLAELPRFTPETPWLTVLFGAAREGTEVLFLIVIPAAAAIFAIIGVLEYAGFCQFVVTRPGGALTYLSIDQETGIISILASPTLAMGLLTKTAASVSPKLVVGSFVLAASGFPLSVIFGQIPMIWHQATDLTEAEAIKAACIGIGMRIITAWAVAELLTPFIIY